MFSERLEFAIRVATHAGKFTLSHFQTETPVERKSDGSPVTLADRGAERMIREAIETTYPGDSILGEEEGKTGDSANRWVIDPIDGTKSFVAGVPLFGTLLSYEVEGEPVLGVVYFPALNELHFGERGKGAFWNGQPSRVSKKTNLSDSVVCVGSHKNLKKYGHSESFQRIADTALATRTWCDAYGHMLVASGRVEAMIDPVVAYHDVSAVKIIIEEAGGVFSNLAGSPEWREEAMTSAPGVRDEILRLLAP